MSEREPGFGSFVLGVAVGAVLGLLFAPEPGEDFRDKLSRRLRTLRDLAAERLGDLEVGGERRLRQGGRGGRRRPGSAREDEPEV